MSVLPKKKKKKDMTILFRDDFPLKERTDSGPFLNSIITVHGTYISAYLTYPLQDKTSQYYYKNLTFYYL